jgi:hypothetical protein
VIAMMFIVFILLIVIVLAVGVRIVEAGSKFALALALLVVAGVIVRVASQSPAVRADASQTVALAESTERTLPEGQADPQPEVVSDGTEQQEPTSETSEADVVVETAVGEEPPPEIVLEDDAEDADAIRDEGSGLDSLPDENTTRETSLRPKWLECDDIRTGDVDGIDKTAVSSGPLEKMGQCGPALDEALVQAVSDYIDEYLGRVYGDRFKASSVVHFDSDYIREHLVTATFDEPHDFDFGRMYQSHALVEFTPAFRSTLDGQRDKVAHQWQQVVVGSRLVGVALVFGVILAFLAVISGYFRLDTATRGFYTGRLQFLAAVAILAVIVAGALLAKNVHWM